LSGSNADQNYFFFKGGPLIKSCRIDESATIPKSTIRVRDNLTEKPPIQTLNSDSTTDAEIKLLKEEVRALTWSQCYNTILSLLTEG
jgi:hypothetical protein